MKQNLPWILVAAAVIFVGLNGYLDVPIEKARTSMWASINLTSAGSDGKILREWLESRGYETREVNVDVVQARLGKSRFAHAPGHRYWSCAIVKDRPLGEMTLIIYCMENEKGSYLDHKTQATVDGMI